MDVDALDESDDPTGPLGMSYGFIEVGGLDEGAVAARVANDANIIASLLSFSFKHEHPQGWEPPQPGGVRGAWSGRLPLSNVSRNP